MSQNNFLLDWTVAGEASEQQANVISYLSHIKDQNQASVVYWVSKISGNYLTKGCSNVMS